MQSRPIAYKAHVLSYYEEDYTKINEVSCTQSTQTVNTEWSTLFANKGRSAKQLLTKLN